MPELGEQLLQTSAQQIALGGGDLGAQAPPLPHAATRPGEQAIEVMQQALQRVRWGLLLKLALDLQIQLRILDQTLANRRRRVAPGGIQRGDLAAGELLLGDRLSEALTRLPVDARQRHQRLHGRLRGDLSTPDPLLDRCRQLAHQSQAPRDPAGTAVEALGQLLLAPTDAASQLRQQPPLLERRLARGVAQAALQDQRLGFAEIPQRRLHRVVSQTLQRSKPLVAVDDDKPIGGFATADDDDRLLLAVGLQRGPQSPLPLRALHPQRLVTPIQLVKLQVHRSSAAAAVGPAGEPTVASAAPRSLHGSGAGGNLVLTQELGKNALSLESSTSYVHIWS